ncbi:MAG: 30S ribosomal protein S11 [Verrucomicrobiota bacterium]
MTAAKNTPRGKKTKRKVARNVANGIAHIEASFNNTKIVITDTVGNVLTWCTAGRLGYKGSRKSTSYVAQLVGAEAAKEARGYGMRQIEIRIKGPGSGRESAARGVASTGLEVTAIRDVTPVPHNGCRPPKRRRV